MRDGLNISQAIAIEKESRDSFRDFFKATIFQNQTLDSFRATGHYP